MQTPAEARADEATEDTAGIGRRILIVLVVQFATVVALYWFGQYFS